MSDKPKKRTAKPIAKYKIRWYIQDFWESLEFVAPRRALWIALIGGSVIALIGFALVLADLDILNINYDGGVRVAFVTNQERQQRQELSREASDRQTPQADRSRFAALPHTWSGSFSGEINYWGPLGTPGCYAHYDDNKVTVALGGYDETVNSGGIEMIMKGQVMVTFDMQWRDFDLRQCMERIGKSIATMDIIYGTPVRQEFTVQDQGTFSFDDSSHDRTVLSVSIESIRLPRRSLQRGRRENSRVAFRRGGASLRVVEYRPDPGR